MIRLGLTGSIGMGKSTTAGMFAARGDAVIDADALVHALYAGRAVAPIESAFPGVTQDGRVDRKALSAALVDDPGALPRLEAIVHPLVREEEQRALEAAEASGRRIAVLDIPLLFETGRDRTLDAVVVVSAPEDVQRDRVLARPGMSEDTFKALKARQMSDAEKRRRAHFIVETGAGLAAAEAAVCAIRRAVLTIG